MGCIDRVQFDIEGNKALTIAITGFITDQPGPYEIQVRRSFPVSESNWYEAPVAVKQMLLIDNDGNEEVLKEKKVGFYETDENFRGVNGKSYRLRVEFFDGKIYESVADTLPTISKLDTIYSRYRTFTNVTGGFEFYFDVFFNTRSSLEKNFYFFWNFSATFKINTNPELELEENPKGSTPCSYIDIDCERCHPCNMLPKCTGLRNVGNVAEPKFIRVAPCTCCTCWYSIYNDRPILTNYEYLNQGRFEDFKVGSIRLDDYILQSKIFIDVDQFTISRPTYLFYKAIKDQKDGATSLFQPPSGSIPSNFRQIAGSPEPIIGFFYAASVSRKTIVLTKDNVPPGGYAFVQGPLRLLKRTCVGIYPNSTTTRPLFWVD
ncbi:MAG: DUF4249 family protein [Cyclobacteriaceae bacterium]|jgi:hypothetical protein